MNATSSKSARLEMRATHEQKQLIERAATLRGESITSFMLSHLIQVSQNVIQEHYTTELSLQDWEMFTDLLNSPKPANEALKNAAKRYQMHIKHSDGLE
jgi:uncharacterized protein (DUF1778 family)